MIWKMGLTYCAYNRHPQKSQSSFWGFPSMSSYYDIHEKTYEIFEKLQNKHEDFQCLLYAHHVKFVLKMTYYLLYKLYIITTDRYVCSILAFHVA